MLPALHHALFLPLFGRSVSGRQQKNRALSHAGGSCGSGGRERPAGLLRWPRSSGTVSPEIARTRHFSRRFSARIPTMRIEPARGRGNVRAPTEAGLEARAETMARDSRPPRNTTTVDRPARRTNPPRAVPSPGVETIPLRPGGDAERSHSTPTAPNEPTALWGIGGILIDVSKHCRGAKQTHFGWRRTNPRHLGRHAKDLRTDGRSSGRETKPLRG